MKITMVRSGSLEVIDRTWALSQERSEVCALLWESGFQFWIRSKSETKRATEARCSGLMAEKSVQPRIVVVGVKS